jgi:beta-ribofuranosylaminobenzene 5'-phosphate synthase
MIEVRANARLHLGLLDNNGDLGRLYGSIGLAVDRPKLVLKADKSRSLKTEGEEQERVLLYARRFISKFHFPAGARLKLERSIPSHVGLGSGTQIALAVGTALAALSDRRVGIEEIALAAGRGAHSGIGISTFRYGGFVLDGGRPMVSGASRELIRDRVPPLLFKQSIPKNWYFVVAIPNADPGLSGGKERQAFSKLPRAPVSLVEKISRVLLIQMLPALVEKDIAGFGQAMTRIQLMVGDCFSSVQGGRFANPASEKMVEYMLSRGAAGIGQSSWGPTVYGLVEGKDRALKLLRGVISMLESIGGGNAFPVRACNRGARISLAR